MSGYLYNESEPTEECPYCGSLCRADFADIGVGMIQCGPYHCDKCGASEMGPEDKKRPLTDREKSCGWCKPGSEPGSSANVIDGHVVTHSEVLNAYRREFVGNPRWHDKSYVSAWWERIRARKEATRETPPDQSCCRPSVASQPTATPPQYLLARKGVAEDCRALLASRNANPYASVITAEPPDQCAIKSDTDLQQMTAPELEELRSGVSRRALALENKTLRGRVETLEAMDRDAGRVECVICLRSRRFTGSPPYVGWEGLEKALNEDYDELERLRGGK